MTKLGRLSGNIVTVTPQPLKTPAKAAGEVRFPELQQMLSARDFLLLDGLLGRAQKLKRNIAKVGIAPFVAIIGTLEADRAYAVIHHFVQYRDDFNTPVEFLVFSFTCDKYLLKMERKRIVETYPVEIDSPAKAALRQRKLDAVKKIGKAAALLSLTPDECRKLVDELPADLTEAVSNLSQRA